MCPDASVFWVHASSAERFRQAYISIAQKCQVPGYGDPKADVLLLVKSWLEGQDCGRWLMVIDNADDMQVFSQLGGLGQCIPECAHGSILVTTRNKEAGSRLTKGRLPIEVKKMDESESRQLLQEKLEDENLDLDDLSMLLSRLEHLPLALAQAAAFIQEKTISISDYLQLLNKSDQNRVDLLSEEFEAVGRDSEAPRAVAETWILSFEQIQRQNAFAAELLSLMSLFDRQAIPIEFLSHYEEQHQHNGPRGEIQLTKALGVLKAFSFVVERKGRSLDMHRLVQLVTQKWLNENGKTKHFAGQALLVVSKLYPFGTFENQAICGTYLTHADAVLRLDHGGSREEQAAKASLLHCAGRYFYFQARWKDSENFILQAVELQGRLLEEEDPDRLTGIGNLAATYWKQGRCNEAELLEVQIVEVSKRILGEEHPDTLIAIGNLASTYRHQGRWNEAEVLEVQVVEASKRTLGEDHLDTLTSIGNLASTYWKQGRWNEAESLEVQVVEARMRILGEEHPDTLTSMHSLALTLHSQSFIATALALMQRCFHLRRQVLGPEHPDTISTLATLNEWKLVMDDS
jgi:hypothetical protein